jgi:hypothetical protein
MLFWLARMWSGISPVANRHVVGNLARCEQQVHLLGAEGVHLDRAQVDVQRLVELLDDGAVRLRVELSARRAQAQPHSVDHDRALIRRRGLRLGRGERSLRRQQD